MLNSCIDLNFFRCYGNKNGRQNKMKMGNWPFWSKFETFDREINIEHKQIPKGYENVHDTQHIKFFFGICLC